MPKQLFGRRVRIIGITHASDEDLNGATGELRRKFIPDDRGGMIFGDVGVWLDQPIDGAHVVNVLCGEFEFIKGD